MLLLICSRYGYQQIISHIKVIISCKLLLRVYGYVCLLTTVVRKVAENPITFCHLQPRISPCLHRIIDRNAVQHRLRTGTVCSGIRPCSYLQERPGGSARS